VFSIDLPFWPVTALKILSAKQSYRIKIDNASLSRGASPPRQQHLLTACLVTSRTHTYTANAIRPRCRAYISAAAWRDGAAANAPTTTPPWHFSGAPQCSAMARERGRLARDRIPSGSQPMRA